MDIDDILIFFKHLPRRWQWRRIHAPSAIPRVEPLPDSAPDFHKLGRAGEEAACRLLEQEGYLVLFRNWRASHYEIDIIAQRGRVIAFVEVKTRSTLLEKVALDAIDSEKLYNIKRSIGYFRCVYPQYASFTFHVDAITVLGRQEPFLIKHYVHPYRKRFEDNIPTRDHFRHRGRRRRPEY